MPTGPAFRKLGAKVPSTLRQKDVAAAARVDPATVSRALNNDPRLSEETRKRILRIAASMGYRPDPLLSALASYRRRGVSGRNRPGMAYLRSSKAPTEAYHLDLLRGARGFAARYGYSIDCLHYDRPDDSSLERILTARGIRGLLIEPFFPEDAGLTLKLGTFAVVVVDNPFFSQEFDRVTVDTFGLGQEAFEQCWQRGYERPGLVVSGVADRNAETKPRGGYWMKMLEHHPRPLLAPLVLPEWNEAKFRRWFAAEKIDAVITSQAFIMKAKASLESLGRSIPSQVGLVNSNIHELPSPVSGIYHNNEAIGAFAAEWLVNKLARNDYGPSAHPHVISQKGRWIEAGTLRRLPPTSTSSSLGRRLVP